ncbi:hypothetical protein [Streptomyces sp. NPDC051000]|uniref:hypothetical protein n=1 Tax=Streptomyces sp. NPDC051000 TaxID=3155520 RepID=UPI0033C4B099
MSATLLAGIARTTEPQAVLRRFLALDALVTAGNGLAYLAFSEPLGRLLGVGPATLLVLGPLLALYGAGVAGVASRRRPPVFPVRLVIETNCLWVALSLAAALFWFTPTAAGAVWIAAQALVVAGFALVQWLALRGSLSGHQ